MNPPDSADVQSLGGWWRRYGSCYEGRSWRDYRHLLGELVRHAPGPPFLDIGCGYGYLVECARRFGIPATGLEGAAPALEAAVARHPHADIRAWSAGTSLPCAGESIGAVMANEVIDHFSAPHNEHLFAEVARVLVPDGALLINSPSRLNRFDDDEGHVSGYTPSELKASLARHGLCVVAAPYQPQPLLGTGGPGWLIMRAMARIAPLERWNARVDLVAIKRG